MASPYFDQVRELVSRLKGPSVSPESLPTDKDIPRIAKTLALIPRAASDGDVVVDVGARTFWAPIYAEILGYRRIVFVWRPGMEEEKIWWSMPGVEVQTVCCDAELDEYPISSESVTQVCVFEVLEHLAGDPMHMLAEINRILKPDGRICLSTPNVLWRENALRFLFGGHPFAWSPYTCTYADRHNHEFTPHEVQALLHAAGMDAEYLGTHDKEQAAGKSLLRRGAEWMICLPAAVLGRVPLGLRNRETVIRAVRRSGLRQRYPQDFYTMYGRSSVSLPSTLTRAGR